MLKKEPSFMLLMGIVSISVILSVGFVSHSINKDWDMTAFLGSLIGSGVTFYGVQYAIRKEREKEFLETVPQKLMIIHKLIEEFISIRINLTYYYDEKTISEATINKLHEQSSKADQYLQHSASVDVDVYKITRYFIRRFNFILKYCDDIDMAIRTGEEIDLSDDVLSLSRLINELNEIRKKYEEKIGLMKDY